jgi:hypothetical protein
MKKAPAASIICIEGVEVMRPTILVCISLALTAAIARAENNCGPAGPGNPCELAAHYAAIGTSTLPETAEEFGVDFTIDTAIAEDEKLIVGATTSLTQAEVIKVLAASNRDVSDLQAMVDDFLPDAICSTLEGPDFINAGGQLVVFVVSADGKTLVTSAVQSCPGES